MAEEEIKKTESTETVDTDKDVENILGDDALDDIEPNNEIIGGDDDENEEQEEDAIDLDEGGGILTDENEYIEDEDETENDESTVSAEPSDDLKKKIIEKVSEQLAIDDIPNTKEFRMSAINLAKEAVCKELEVDDYDNFDEEHQALFIEKFEQIREQKKAKFNNAVKEARTVIESQNTKERVLSELKNICGSDENIKKLNEALGGVSYNAYNEMQSEIAKGNPKKFLEFARNFMGKQNNRKSTTSHKQQKPKSNKHYDRGFASDIVFGY